MREVLNPVPGIYQGQAVGDRVRPTVPTVRLLYGVLVDNVPFTPELGTPEGAHVEEEGKKFVGGQVVARRAVGVEYVHGGRTTVCHYEVPMRPCVADEAYMLSVI